MISIWDATYIVTDVETTGSHSIKNRMTEIACVTTRGGDIIKEYDSLVNPYQTIPPYVARMTGISQSMVNEAPDEYELVDDIKSLFLVDNPVFVAHNVNFDYGFVSSFFKRGFIQFDYPQLCTLKLARKLLPRDIKKNVGDLSAYFGIKLKNRHRALIDAKATAMILSELLYIAEREHNIQYLDELLQFQNKPVFNYKVPNEVTNRLKNRLNDVPNCPGIFKFLDSKNKMIYWDYSFNLRSKVHSFFDTHYITSKPLLEITQKISKIDFVTVETELAALILRHNFAKQFPVFQKKQSNEELFPKMHTNGVNSIIDFIYVQAQSNNEKVTDIYFIKSGTLKSHTSIGRRADQSELFNIIYQIFFTESESSENTYEEYKIIKKWVEMQNYTGIKIITKNKNFDELKSEVSDAMSRAYDLVELPSEFDFQI